MVIDENLKRQTKTIFVWYSKERAHSDIMDDENSALRDNELVIVGDFFKTSKHASLCVQNEFRHNFILK